LVGLQAGLLLLVGLTSANLLAAAAESNLDKSFDVKPGGQLIVDADRGSIDIRAGGDSEVQIEVKRKIPGVSQARAEELFAAHQIAFDQDGDRVSVSARLKKDLSRRLERDAQKLQVEYRVTVPKRFNLDLRTSAGSIGCGDLEGAVKARTAGGSLKFGSVQGPFDGTTAAGTITLAGASGSVTAKTSGGSIRLGQVDADTTVETAAGSVTVKAAKAKLMAKTSGGSIEFGELTGPAKAESSAGSIKVGLAQSKLEANTSGGSIEIADARDTVLAHTSAGSITATFSAQPREDCRLTTSGGGIQVRLAEDLAFDIEARTSGGRVTTELPITATVLGEHKADALHGKLNGGGKALVLKTSAGNIAIRKQ